jgi:hypothetical protein
VFCSHSSCIVGHPETCSSLRVTVILNADTSINACQQCGTTAQQFIICIVMCAHVPGICQWLPAYTRICVISNAAGKNLGPMQQSRCSERVNLSHHRPWRCSLQQQVEGVTVTTNSLSMMSAKARLFTRLAARPNLEIYYHGGHIRCRFVIRRTCRWPIMPYSSHMSFGPTQRLLKCTAADFAASGPLE